MRATASHTKLTRQRKRDDSGGFSAGFYQFCAELKDYELKIWRRLQAAGNITMAQLGYILMTTYEMQASHLFRITVPIRENHALYMKVKSGYDIVPAFPDESWVFQLDDGENFFPYPPMFRDGRQYARAA